MNNQTSVSFCELLCKIDPCSSETFSLDCSLVKSTTSSVCVDWSLAEGDPVISWVLSIEVSVCSGIEVSRMQNSN